MQGLILKEGEGTYMFDSILKTTLSMSVSRRLLMRSALSVPKVLWNITAI